MTLPRYIAFRIPMKALTYVFWYVLRFFATVSAIKPMRKGEKESPRA